MQPIARLFSLILTTIPLMMKKTFTLIISLLISVSIFGQFIGSGTASDPYSGGTLTSSQTWTPVTDTIYVSGLLTIAGTSRNPGSLTISSGVFVVFVSSSGGIKIDPYGNITANGTSSEKITFTADHNNNKIFGETDETWENLFFYASTKTSLLNFCILEYGNPSSVTGGGVYLSNTDDITISNCLFRNCTATYGGGIEIEDSDPTIENSIFLNNAGAGIDVYGVEANPTITNCTFVDNNNTNSGEYGGIQITDGTATIKNCVLWNNMCSSSTGYDYSGSGTISYSAATQTITGTGMIDLTVSNTGTLGPNFTNPTSHDYSIKLISPLRDAGTDTGAPDKDYAGNNRISPCDIGAYEVQYSRWTGATSDVWNLASNWAGEGIPSSSNDVVIPSGKSNYPTSSSTQDFIIGSGKYMIIEPNAQVTLGTLANFTGTLTLESDATGIASLMVNTYFDSGTENIELYLEGDGDPNYKWHYISAPVSGATPSVFSGTTDNILIYRETEVLTDSSVYTGWAWYDGFTSTDVWGLLFTTIDVGRGYNVYHSSNHTFTFHGSLNTSFSSYSLSFSGTDDVDTVRNGYNLLGNPFTCGLDWDEITGDASYPTRTSKAVYFTKDNAPASNSNGVGTNGGSDSIPPMQGFFVKTYHSGKTIPVPASAKMHNSFSRYKNAVIIPLVRFEISKNDVTDETVVRFDNNALETLDYDFDALKIMRKDEDLLIWSKLFETEFSINGIPFPENSMDIPLVINSPKADSLKITATQIQGLEDYDLTLKDLDQNVNIDLNEINEYIFNADSGTVTDRFIFTVTNLASGLPDIFEPEPEKAFNIYSSREILYISLAKDEWNGKRGDLRIYDITGKIVMQQKNIEWYKGVTKEISLNVAQGIYLVEICSATERFVGRVGIVR